MRPLVVQTRRRGERRDITAAVGELVWKSEVFDGLCHVVTPHRTAGLSIGPGTPTAAPTAARTLADGSPAPRHHLALIVAQRRLFLAPGERLWLHEEAGPHRRKVVVRVEAAPRRPPAGDEDAVDPDPFEGG